jgi:hypothetical protein
MRCSELLVILLSTTSLAVLTLSAQEQHVSISGVVSDRKSQQRLGGVIVTVVPLSQDRNRRSWSSKTDDSGSFTITSLERGLYHLTAERYGYPEAATLTVDLSEASTSTNIELTPGASVSGRILDEDGEPLRGCWVQARRLEYFDKILSPQVARTDSEPSDYLLDGLPSGHYILGAECKTQPFEERPFSTGPDPVPNLGYRLTFYPNAFEMQSAEPVNLTVGSERVGVDFVLRPQHVTQLYVKLKPRGPAFGQSLIACLISADDSFQLEGVSSSDGFVFPRVFVGSYFLAITSQDSQHSFSAIKTIEVSDLPITLTVDLKPAAAVRGKVEIEKSGKSEGIHFSELAFQLRQKYSGLQTLIWNPEARVLPDGHFVFDAVVPTRWHLEVIGAPVFIKTVEIGGREMSGKELDVSSAVEDLKIVLSTNTGGIGGSASPGSTILWRDLSDTTSFSEPRVVSVALNGHFRIQGLAPGRYSLVQGSLSDLIPTADWQEITISDGEVATVDFASR